MLRFSATIEIIGVNPYVEVPPDMLQILLQQAKKNQGPIPVKGTLQGKPFMQTVVKFRGIWRLYLNTPMREASHTTVGDTVQVELEYDPKPRIVKAPAAFLKRLKENKNLYKAFKKLPPYRQKELSRYLSSLKSEEALQRNIEKVIRHLRGEKVESVLFYKRQA